MTPNPTCQHQYGPIGVPFSSKNLTVVNNICEPTMTMASLIATSPLTGPGTHQHRDNDNVHHDSYNNSNPPTRWIFIKCFIYYRRQRAWGGCYCHHYRDHSLSQRSTTAPGEIFHNLYWFICSKYASIQWLRIMLPPLTQASPLIDVLITAPGMSTAVTLGQW